MRLTQLKRRARLGCRRRLVAADTWAQRVAEQLQLQHELFDLREPILQLVNVGPEVS